MRIRLATLEDIDRIVAMGERFIAETPYARFGSAPEQLEQLLAIVLEHGAGFLAETDDGQIVGMIGFIASKQVFTGAPYASEVVWWMEPEYRGGTAGPRLLVAGEEWATRKGLTSITMIAPVGTELHAFYARRGYVPVETIFLKGLDQYGRTDNHACADRRERRGRRTDREETRGEESQGRG